MFLIHVYPLVKGVAPYRLTYFSKEKIARGAVVLAQLRNRNTPVLVAKCESAERARSAIRKQDHQLTPIKKQTPRFPFHPTLLAALEAHAAEGTVPAGALAHTFIGKSFPEDPSLWPTKRTTATTTKKEHLVAVQASETERDEQLLTLVREQWAKRKSVLVVTPSRHEAERIGRALHTLPHEKVVLMHAERGKKDLRNAHVRITESDPCVIVASQTYAAVNRTDIGALYIERASSPLWQRDARPLAHMRILFEHLASELGIPCTIADTILDIADHESIKGGRMEGRLMRQRIEATAEFKIFDRRPEKTSMQKHPLAVETLQHVQLLLQKAESVFVLSGRRGLSAGITCGHCKEPVRCNTCHTPFILIGPNAKIDAPRFFCRHCGKSRDSHARCEGCDSWKLEAVGTGSDHIAHTLKRLFPNTPVTRIDSESASTESKVKKLMTAFVSTPGILVGTERALPYLSSIPHSVVVSYDASLSVPEPAAGTHALVRLSELLQRSTQSMIVETRMPEHPILLSLKARSPDVYLSEETAMRKLLGFPPFGTHIEITRLGKQAEVQRDMVKLQTWLAPNALIFTPTFIRGMRGTTATIQLPPQEIAEELLAKLRALPPTHSVRIAS